MSGLKSLRQRIQSIKSTKKVTKAMQIVSASKLKKVRTEFEYVQEYLFKTHDIFENVMREYVNLDMSITNEILLNKDNNENYEKKALFIILGSDKGLCGSFNSGIFRKLPSVYSKFKDASIITVGKKVHEYIKQKYASHVLKNYSIKSNIFDLAVALKNDILSVEGLNSVYLCYNHFRSNISQVPVIKNIFEIHQDLKYKHVESSSTVKHSPASHPSQYIIEGNNLLFDAFVGYINAAINCSIVENKVSEEAIRMVMMDSATKNAEKMIDGLTLKFNRQRQAMITTELIEIISGAEALKSHA